MDIRDMMNKVLILENDESKYISKEEFFHRNGIDNEKVDYMGEGDFGTAFYDGNGRVIKITTSRTEILHIKNLFDKRDNKMFNLAFVNIFDIAQINKRDFIYLMEELNTDDAEERYDRYDSLLQDNNMSIGEILHLDDDDIDYTDNEDLEQFSRDLYYVTSAYQRLGVSTPDIHSGNLGYDNDGNLKAFDIDSKEEW